MSQHCFWCWGRNKSREMVSSFALLRIGCAARDSGCEGALPPRHASAVSPCTALFRRLFCPRVYTIAYTIQPCNAFCAIAVCVCVLCVRLYRFLASYMFVYACACVPSPCPLPPAPRPPHFILPCACTCSSLHLSPSFLSLPVHLAVRHQTRRR